MQLRKLNQVPAGTSRDLHFGVQRNQSRSPVAGIYSDAVFARSKNRVFPVRSVKRCATRTWTALVAFLVAGVPEVAAAGPLKYVPAQPRHVAKLLRCRLPQTFCQQGIIANDTRILMQLSHRNKGADTQTRGDPIFRKSFTIIGRLPHADRDRRSRSAISIRTKKDHTTTCQKRSRLR